MNIDLEPQVGRRIPYLVEDVDAVALRELNVVVVVTELDSLISKTLCVLVELGAERRQRLRRSIDVEDEVTALVDYGDGVTGTFVAAVHDLVGTDRFEILGDRGKIVVDGSRTATVSRLVQDERELSESLGPEDLDRLFRGGFDRTRYYTQEVIEPKLVPGAQQAGVLENFGANILYGTPLLAPGCDGVDGVRFA